MNVNELFNAITNIRIKLKSVKEDVAFTNSDIVFLGGYTFSGFTYDPDAKQIIALIEPFNPNKEDHI